MPLLSDISAADYYADNLPGSPLLSQSIAHQLINHSPAHAFLAHPKLGGKPITATREMEKGTIIHDMLLNDGKLDGIEILQYENFRTKAAQEERDLVIDMGKMPILEKDYHELTQAAQWIRSRFQDLKIDLHAENAEQVVTWEERTDKGESVQCKGKLDHAYPSWTGFYIDDLKTCSSAHPKSIQRSLFDYGYVIQHAAYTSAIEKIYPEAIGRVRFRFIFVELSPPYSVTPVVLNGSAAAVGRSQWRRAVNTWAECLKTGVWPGYVEETYRAEAPIWQIKDELDKSPVTAELSQFLEGN